MRDPNRISAPCWDDHHNRCTGWMVVPGIEELGLSVRCECDHCNHPAVSPNRHHYRKPQPTSTWGPTWSSSTTTR